MDSLISAALITGGATILAAFIGVVGVTLIFWHRRTVINLCREIYAYHAQEGWLVAKLFEVEKQRHASAEQVKHWRGKYRNEASLESKPSMTPKQARGVQHRFGSFD